MSLKHIIEHGALVAVDKDRKARKEMLEEDIEDAKHQIHRCLTSTNIAESGYGEEYQETRDSWLRMKQELENASDDMRKDLQREVDDLFSKMKGIEEKKT